jgi:hypothetical protein
LNWRKVRLGEANGFRLHLGAGQTLDSGYGLHFSPYAQVAKLEQQWQLGVQGLDQPLALEIVLWDNIIDVCIDGRRTLIDRCPGQRGTRVLFYAEDSAVTFDVVEIAALP